ncbi:MAG: L,D-transpeptidase [Chloroflexota bacterium]|nr:L,D-transpeptidase [Chloroflexota bacterium]
MTAGLARNGIHRGGRLLRTALLAMTLLCAPIAIGPEGHSAAAYPVDPNWTPPPTVYIPETGQTIDRLFLDLWRTGGGLFTYGYPITPEIEEAGGTIVQYFEYARFEYWPQGDANGNLVVLGAIGAEFGAPVLPRRLGYNASTAAHDSARIAKAWLPLRDDDAAAKSAGEPSYLFVPETRHGTWGAFRGFWEATGGAAYLGNPVSEEYAVNGTNFQVFERGKLQWRVGEDVSMVAIGQLLAERYRLSTAPQPQGDVPIYDEGLFVPPRAIPSISSAPTPPNNDRAIVVSLSRQALWAYENGEVIDSTYVSTGTEKFKTPTGLYYVNTKVDSQTMEGVLGGEYYNVPDVPYVMYFTDRGHAIHGAYWHDNFGQTMSHGCINLPLDIAAWMYAWAPMGMAISIIE